MRKPLSWQEVLPGAIIQDAGNAAEYETGSWRTYRPIFHEDRCTQCLLCWIYCPDSAVMVDDGKVTGFDLEHCKGCGICANECPPKCNAITMELETR
jgi:pyruvate ferredoxin oxidoreductase delta subunit